MDDIDELDVDLEEFDRGVGASAVAGPPQPAPQASRAAEAWQPGAPTVWAGASRQAVAAVHGPAGGGQAGRLEQQFEAAWRSGTQTPRGGAGAPQSAARDAWATASGAGAVPAWPTQQGPGVPGTQCTGDGWNGWSQAGRGRDGPREPAAQAAQRHAVRAAERAAPDRNRASYAAGNTAWPNAPGATAARAPGERASLPMQLSQRVPGPAGVLQQLEDRGCVVETLEQLVSMAAEARDGGNPAHAPESGPDASAGAPHGLCADPGFRDGPWKQAAGALELPSDPRHFGAGAGGEAGGPQGLRTVHDVNAVTFRGKAAAMVVLVASLRLTGTGDARCVLKDPTGTISAAVTAAALDAEPAIGPGAVLALRNVTVLAVRPRNHYLCITPCSIAQVYAPAARDEEEHGATDAARGPPLLRGLDGEGGSGNMAERGTPPLERWQRQAATASGRAALASAAEPRPGWLEGALAQSSRASGAQAPAQAASAAYQSVVPGRWQAPPPAVPLQARTNGAAPRPSAPPKAPDARVATVARVPGAAVLGNAPGPAAAGAQATARGVDADGWAEAAAELAGGDGGEAGSVRAVGGAAGGVPGGEWEADGWDASPSQWEG
ncbi:unnamed protein product [Pedinophyceae sp. YPF-701]|nr:unnamed protein product [Pedinophyceae sp. YPF-701]